MNYKPSISLIVGITAAVLLAVVVLVGIRHDLAHPTPSKPEIESVVVETNVPATIITWTKTSNGHTVTFGYVQISGKPHFLFPFTE
jgi:hypothetical protein